MFDYTDIKILHVICVLLSGALFSLRGVFMLLKSSFSQHPVLKRFSYFNDTVLLLAGVVLAVSSATQPFSHPWLAAKLLFLPLYIILGLYALRLASSYRGRVLFLVGALIVYSQMIAVAWFRSPLGWLSIF